MFCVVKLAYFYTISRVPLSIVDLNGIPSGVSRATDNFILETKFSKIEFHIEISNKHKEI